MYFETGFFLCMIKLWFFTVFLWSALYWNAVAAPVQIWHSDSYKKQE